LMGISLLKGLASFFSFFILWYLGETPNINIKKKMKNWFFFVVHTVTFKRVKCTPILELSIKSHN
jgi:hypothetical protein